jgi:H+/Cl- antiporter ClcA
MRVNLYPDEVTPRKSFVPVHATSIMRDWLALDWRDRLLGGYFRKWVVLAVLIGTVAGVGAIVFFEAIDLATKLFLGWIAGLDPPLPAGDGQTVVTSADRRWLLPIVVALGGLLSGLIVFTLAPEAEGHGTDAAIDAFHRKGGRIRSRIPPIKLVASAIRSDRAAAPAVKARRRKLPLASAPG